MTQKIVRSQIVAEAIGKFQFHLDGGSDNRSAMTKALEAAIARARILGWYEGLEHRKADRNLSTPEFTGKPGARPKYPFWKMEIGDVYEVCNVHKFDVQNAARSYGHRHGKKFSVEGENGLGSVFVKRVS